MTNNVPYEFFENILNSICQKHQCIDAFVANKCQSIDIYVHLHKNQQYGKFSLPVL